MRNISDKIGTANQNTFSLLKPTGYVTYQHFEY